MDFPSWNDLFQIAADEALLRNAQLTRESVERAGSDANVLLAGAAAVGDEDVNQLADVAAGLYLDSAEAEALDRLVFDRYGLLRKPAQTAYGSVSFSTTVNNPAPFAIPTGTLLQTASGTQFITTADATFNSGTTVGPIVAVRSVLAGASQQAAIGTITSIIGQITGQPSDLVVTNTVATAGAADAEDDSSLRNRARQFFVTARRGTLSAVKQGALAVPGVTQATVFEVLDIAGRPAREVMVVIADTFTDSLAQLDSVPPLYQQQSQVLTTAVVAGLSDVRPAGICVQAIVASVVLQAVHLSLKFNAGVDANAVADEARSTVVNYINRLEPGQTLTLNGLQNSIKGVSGLFYTGTEVTVPIGDVVPKTLQVLRTTLALVTAGSAQTDQPLAPSNNPDAFQRTTY